MSCEHREDISCAACQLQALLNDAGIKPYLHKPGCDMKTPGCCAPGDPRGTAPPTLAYNCPRCGYHATTNQDARDLERELEAAREQHALEEAAKVLDDELRLRPVAWGADHGQTTPLHRLARDIRAIAAKEPR